MRARAGAITGFCVLALVLCVGAGGAASRPDGVLLGLPGSLVLLAVLATCCGIARVWGWAEGERGLALVPVLVAVVAASAWPALRPISGSVLLAFGAAALVAVAASRRPAWEARLFFPLVLVLYLGVAARVQQQVGPQGDEPHYLMVADSLLRDHDLALDRDYAEGRYQAFYQAGTLEPHYRVRGRDGRVYSLHALGLSIVVLPAYALGGYPAASFFMALLGAVLALEVRRLVVLVSGSGPVGAAVGWVVALSPPLVHYAGLVFTEVPAALIVAWTLRAGMQAATGTTRGALAAGSALALLPWLNVRYALLAGVLLLHAWSWRPRPSRAAAWALPLAASVAGIVAYHQLVYGFADPRRVYGARPELSLRLVPDGLQGLLLDQEFGLLVYAPVFVLAAVGLWGVLREATVRRVGLAAAAVVAVVVLTAASWPMWRGGWNPPARFLVPVVPALALGVGWALRRGPSARAALAIGWGLWLGLAGAMQPSLVHRDRDGTAPLLRQVSGAEEWTRLLPGYVLPDHVAEGRRRALVWALVLLAVAVPRRSAGLPSTMALAAANLGLIVAAVVASKVAVGTTGGRDAVRLVGRPTVALPTLGIAGDEAAWLAADVGLGTYEPHRFPDGAVLGERLALPAGRYRLRVAASGLGGPVLPAVLGLQPEPGGTRRSGPLLPLEPGLQAEFEVRPSERAVTLLLQGGGALTIQQVRIQPFPAGTVQTSEEGGTAMSPSARPRRP